MTIVVALKFIIVVYHLFPFKFRLNLQPKYMNTTVKILLFVCDRGRVAYLHNAGVRFWATGEKG